MNLDKIARVLFADTVNGRMLRKLACLELWSQAEFMREYHVRCERARPSRSMFHNNFGRYAFEVVYDHYHQGRLDAPPPTERREPLGTFTKISIPLIERVGRPPEKTTSEHARNWERAERRQWGMWQRWHAIRDQFGAERLDREEIKLGGSALVWRGPSVEALLRGMTPESLSWSFESMERQITVCRASDALVTERTPAEWCVLIQAEIARRALGGCTPGHKVMHMHTPRPGVHTVVNGCALHPHNHLEPGADQCGPHPAL